MDVNALTAMLQTILEQKQSAQQEARRHSEAAMSQMLQGQNAFLENLAQVVSRGQTSVEAASRGPLVDPRGVAKPADLTAKIASNPAGFRAWRLKYRNWVLAALPAGEPVLKEVEDQNQVEVSLARFTAWVTNLPMVTQLSAQVKASLVSLTSGEPFDVVTKGPQGPQAGLEAYRRLCHRYEPTGPRSVKLVLKRALASHPVPASRLRPAVEELEELFEEFRIRAGEPLQECVRMLILEQLLDSALKTHVELNSESLNSYDRLRSAVWNYAERVGEAAALSDGVAPMEIGALQGSGIAGTARPKASSQVTCWSCGRQGHRSADCRAPAAAKAAAVAAGKAKASAKSPAPKGKAKAKAAGRAGSVGMVQPTGPEDPEAWPGDAPDGGEGEEEIQSLFVLFAEGEPLDWVLDPGTVADPLWVPLCLGGPVSLSRAGASPREGDDVPGGAVLPAKTGPFCTSGALLPGPTERFLVSASDWSRHSVVLPALAGPSHVSDPAAVGLVPSNKCGSPRLLAGREYIFGNEWIPFRLLAGREPETGLLGTFPEYPLPLIPYRSSGGPKMVLSVDVAARAVLGFLQLVHAFCAVSSSELGMSGLPDGLDWHDLGLPREDFFAA